MIRQLNSSLLFPVVEKHEKPETTAGFLPVWLKMIGLGRRLRVGLPGRVTPLPLSFVLTVIALACTKGNLAFPNKHGNSYVDGRQHNVLPLNFESLLGSYNISNERDCIQI